MPHPQQGHLSRCSSGRTRRDVAARGRTQAHASASASSSSHWHVWSEVHTAPCKVTIDSLLHLWGRLPGAEHCRLTSSPCM